MLGEGRGGLYLSYVLLPIWKLISTHTQKFYNETKEEKRNVLTMLKNKMRLFFRSGVYGSHMNLGYFETWLVCWEVF